MFRHEELSKQSSKEFQKSFSKGKNTISFFYEMMKKIGTTEPQLCCYQIFVDTDPYLFPF